MNILYDREKKRNNNNNNDNNNTDNYTNKLSPNSCNNND
jgi:hypothetical protein